MVVCENFLKSSENHLSKAQLKTIIAEDHYKTILTDQSKLGALPEWCT